MNHETHSKTAATHDYYVKTMRRNKNFSSGMSEHVFFYQNKWVMADHSKENIQSWSATIVIILDTSLTGVGSYIQNSKLDFLMRKEDTRGEQTIKHIWQMQVLCQLKTTNVFYVFTLKNSQMVLIKVWEHSSQDQRAETLHLILQVLSKPSRSKTIYPMIKSS